MATKTIEVCDRCGTAPRSGLNKTVTATLAINGDMFFKSEARDLCNRCVERAKRFMARAVQTKVTK